MAKKAGKPSPAAPAVLTAAPNPLIIVYLEAVHGFPPIQAMDPQAPSPGWNAAT